LTPILWKFNAIQVLALSCFGVAIGIWLKKKLPILDALNIPASIVGGLVYALVALALRDRIINFEMDLSLQGVLMVGFFTTIGLSASTRLVKQGGAQVILFFLLASTAVAIQNLAGVGMAKMLGLNPLLGIISGSVSMAGGPATALAFGQTFESLGVEGASTVGVAAAMFGIVAGGLLGGALGAHIIRKNKLQPAALDSRPSLQPTEDIVYAGDSPAEQTATPMSDESEAESSPLLNNVIAVAVAMGIGTIFSSFFERMGLVLPAYVGAMMAAALMRNIDDRTRWFRISQHQVDAIGNVALYVFIVMALLTLRLWELVHLAGPMFLMLFAQIAIVALLAATATYFLMGRDYDAAVMSGGFSGFMLGTTANAVACMDVLVKKFGPAPRAFIVVPLVGAFLIDFTNALIITAMTNLFR
jgi:glutamate:Na+ symporter, ESS family